ncbi:hypothetical protein [Microcoleus sp. herbarium12]
MVTLASSRVRDWHFWDAGIWFHRPSVGKVAGTDALKYRSNLLLLRLP